MRSHPLSGTFLAALVVAGACYPSAGAEDLLLAENGRSAYRIVIAENASPAVRHGAEELQRFLAEMTGAALPIVSDREPATEQEILVGESARFQQAGLSLDCASLGEEGYHLKTVGRRLAIAGSPQRGALYGVYGLLEDHLGCRWFTPEVSRIPKTARLIVPPLDDRKIPVLEYREPYMFECFDGDWSARNRMNGHGARLEAKHGGKTAIHTLAHTFSALVPPEKYFSTHPEYFSLVGGKRQSGYAQLCCTNEDVIRLCTEATLAAMKSHPAGRIFSVSQNDCFLYCECENCQKLAKVEDSQMAPVLALVNRVAEAAEKEFPQNTVETLAYQWTRKPPKNIRPRKNVLIELCSIECCFSHPLATCDSPENRQFREDVENWSKAGARLWVWDYTTNFANYLMPFPNHRVLRDNIRYFTAHGVKGIFEEDTYDTPHSELAGLDGYLMAKFLWNPDYDENRAITEFLSAYYGPAAESVRKYLDLLRDRVQKENIHVHVYDPVSSPHLADDLLLKANALWEEAEKLAASDPAVLKRVQISRLSVDYAIVERARMKLAGALPLHLGLKALAKNRFAPYIKTLEQSGVTRLSEGAPLNLETYREGLAAGLGIVRGK
jgi:hypothetical protein